MCPACLTTAVLILAGSTTTGGVAAVLLTKLVRSQSELMPVPTSSTGTQKENAT